MGHFLSFEVPALLPHSPSPLSSSPLISSFSSLFPYSSSFPFCPFSTALNRNYLLSPSPPSPPSFHSHTHGIHGMARFVRNGERKITNVKKKKEEKRREKGKKKRKKEAWEKNVTLVCQRTKKPSPRDFDDVHGLDRNDFPTW